MVQPYGFALACKDDFAHAEVMTSDQLTSYLLTQTNVIAAVESGNTPLAARRGLDRHGGRAVLWRVVSRTDEIQRLDLVSATVRFCVTGHFFRLGEVPTPFPIAHTSGHSSNHRCACREAMGSAPYMKTPSVKL